jgi:hypothetical protein
MRVELLATDGKIQKRILFVSTTSNGIYCGFRIKESKTYTTYHSDGNVFTHLNDSKPERLTVAVPLDKFTGFYQLCCGGFSQNMLTLDSVDDYRLNKLDSTVTIDMRSYDGGVSLNVFLVERNNFAILSEVSRSDPLQQEVIECHLFTKFNPWVLFVLYKSAIKFATKKESIES